ncbi:MAG: T9SS type A sorting domain-containing protein, partial [Bacteroidales bacterium]
NNYPNGHIQGLIETNDSNYIACGSYPVARYGGGGGTYLWDGCLRKIDNEGNLLWEKLYRNYSKISSPNMILIESSLNAIIEKDNSLFLLGNHRNHSGASRGYLQKVTNDGSICWNRSYYPIDTTTTYQWLVSIQNTADNGFIMAGYGDEYDRQGIYPPQQAWLVKTDSLGIDGLCYTEYPELNIDIALPTTLNCSDTITVYAYIAGKSAPYTIETSIGQNIDSIYYPPIFVPVEIGLTHVNLEWDNTTYFEQTITEATLSNHEWGQCIAKPIEFYTPNNAGWQQIQITVTDAYGETKTITKEVFVNDNCSNNITEENINGIYLYPNPIKDKLFIDIPQNINPIYAEIYNSLGQLIKSNNVHTGLNVINVSELTSGIYIIKITTNTEKFSLNFEKE